MPAQTSNRPQVPRRKRKARTEVSSSSSSDASTSSADSETDSPPPPPKRTEKTATSSPPSSSAAPDDITSQADSPAQPPRQQQSFEQFYLAQATREFANDLDKLRNAGDFRGGRSVEVLVRGLRQGVNCFGAEERGKIAGGAGEG